MSVGLLLLVYWLMAAADGPEAYDSAMEVLMSGFGKLVIAGFVIAFAYHFCNGIRHLNWDLGRGLERAEARRSARTVVVATILIAAIILLWAFGGGAA